MNKGDEMNGVDTNLSNVEGGGVGVLDRGKLATSRPAARDLIDPNGWSGDSWATGATMPLKQNRAGYHGRRLLIVITFYLNTSTVADLIGKGIFQKHLTNETLVDF